MNDDNTGALYFRSQKKSLAGTRAKTDRLRKKTTILLDQAHVNGLMVGYVWDGAVFIA